jgi:type VI secretion system FHA domain protein
VFTGGLLTGVLADPFESSVTGLGGEPPSFINQPDVAPEHGNFVPPEPDSDISGFNIEELFGDIQSPGDGQKALEEEWQFPDDFFKEAPEKAAKPPKETLIHAPLAEDRKPSAPQVALPMPEPVPESLALEPTPLPSNVTAGTRTTPTLNSELFRLFLEGAGIADLPLPGEEQLPALMRTLGVLLHDLVDGMITVLRARTELKREFRVSVTVMHAEDNNPLKTLLSVEEAMKVMLSAKPNPGFLGPVEAVREGFQDLMDHQMATTAGVQASLAEQLKRFDPKAFEKLYEEGIVFQKKAKCWDAYSEAYPELVTAALENVFGEEFRAVYERQLSILRAAPGHGK